MFKNLLTCLVLWFCLAGAAMAAEADETAMAPADAAAPLCLAANLAGADDEGSEQGFGAKAVCFAVADCTEGPNVDCTGNSVCKVVDQNCPSTRGYVECDGVREYCAPCPPSCTCSQGATCTDDSDCDCNMGFGFCDKESWEIIGTCSCYF